MRIVHRAERIERKPYHESTRRRRGFGGQAKNQKHPPPLKLRRAGEREKASFGRRSTGLSGCKSFIQVTEVD
jgi:hypothetical protein